MRAAWRARCRGLCRGPTWCARPRTAAAPCAPELFATSSRDSIPSGGEPRAALSLSQWPFFSPRKTSYDIYTCLPPFSSSFKPQTSYGSGLLRRHGAALAALHEVQSAQLVAELGAVRLKQHDTRPAWKSLQVSSSLFKSLQISSSLFRGVLHESRAAFERRARPL